MKHSSIKARSGFTLVELLVVVAIIAVLIALLIPAVTRVRSAADRASCGNNLHQIGIAMNAYLATQRAYPGQDWPQLLMSYLEQNNNYSGAPVFMCPANHTDQNMTLDYSGAAQSDSWLYATSVAQISKGTSLTMCLGEIWNPVGTATPFGNSSTIAPAYTLLSGGPINDGGGIYVYVSPPIANQGNGGGSTYFSSYDQGTKVSGDTAYSDESSPTLGPASMKTITVYSYYSGNYPNNQVSYTNSNNNAGYSESYGYLDAAQTQPYSYNWYASGNWGYMNGYAQNFAGYGTTTNLPTATISFQIPPIPGGGFGSLHNYGMNMLMCDGSVRIFPYGVKGLGNIASVNTTAVVELPD